MSEAKYKVGDTFDSGIGDIYTVLELKPMYRMSYTGKNGLEYEIDYVESVLDDMQFVTPWFEVDGQYRDQDNDIIVVRAVWEFNDKLYAAGHYLTFGNSRNWSHSTVEDQLAFSDYRKVDTK